MISGQVNFKSADGGTDYIINNRASIDSGWTSSPFYYVSLDSVDGMWGADLSTESHPLAQAIGEKSGDTFRQGKGLTLSGTIYARNWLDLNKATAFLNHMFWDTAERKLIWTAVDLGISVYVKARVNNDLSIPIGKPQQFGDYTWSWTVGLRADNPRIYKVSDNTLAYSWMT